MRTVFFFFFIITIFACQPSDKEALIKYDLTLPAHFEYPDIPANNPLTESAVKLGKKLFFDPVLSKDTTVACVSCHSPHLAFSDSVAISPGVKGRKGLRNAPSLMNTAWLQNVHRDGGVVKLDLQALAPIEDPDEMDLSILTAAERLNDNPVYVNWSQQAFDKKPDPFVITRALGSYLRTLVSANSPYDQFLQKDTLAMTEQAKRGMNLFFGEKAKCGKCHSGIMLTNNQYENNGLYLHYQDRGRQRITLKEADIGKFRVPGLRNVAITAPYMHDGSLATLEEVLQHYIAGGQAHPNKSPLLQPIQLTRTEQEDLIAFLHALTDEQFSEKK